jgi:hypothetical protein
MSEMWGEPVAVILILPPRDRSALERANVEGEIPVGFLEEGLASRAEYLALAVAREYGGKLPLRLNTTQDR